MREIRQGLQEDVDMSIYNMIPEATRHLYGETPDEIVKNYLKEH